MEEDDKTDRSCSKGRLTDAKEGTFPVCKLQYVDLKNENIFYDNKPDSIKEFVQKVKVDILENLDFFLENLENRIFQILKTVLISLAVLPKKIC